MPKSSQDVRAEVLALRDELIDSLTMIREAIAEDRATMRAYFKRFRDFKYRPVTARDVNGLPTAWGQPTEVIIEPLSTQLRTTVKSLIDSIRVIESEILPDDDPEGRSAGGSGQSTLEARARMRADFKTQSGTPDVKAPEPKDDMPVTRTPKEEVQERDKPSVVEAPKAKPWRETRPGKSGSDTSIEPTPKSEPPKESTPVQPIATPKPIGLSPALRASLAGNIQSEKLNAMKAKYREDED